ncbi:MAG: hypothetical protein ABIQ27_07245 [Flavobacterium sp.]|uniref:hypothetical protein n=1 Tax=Flavobacterium sp. TaxID=239 RepID=UPI003263FC68
MKSIFKILTLSLLFSFYSCAVFIGKSKEYQVKVDTNPPAQSIVVKNLKTSQIVYQGAGGNITLKLKAKSALLKFTKYEILLQRAGFSDKSIFIKLNKKKTIKYNFNTP